MSAALQFRPNCIPCLFQQDFAILQFRGDKMKFPCLVRQKFCKTPIYLTLYGEGVTEDGAPIVIYERKELYPDDDLFPQKNLYGDYLYCNYQDKAKTVLTAQQKKVEVSGVILVPGDIVPDSPTISGGFAEINGVRREIVRGVKARNPDGTVNFTELDVI